jgi:leader peptidase (prepilin peptidase)/N-methyltransferase
LIYIIIVIGLIIGSFLNVGIYRIPKGKSISYPPSHCPKCEERLRSIDLIPVFSYIFNKGKCRYCGENISPRYPIVELMNGFIYMFLYLQFGLTMLFFKYAILSSLLIVISFIDLRYQLIPDRLNVSCLVVGIISTLVYGNKTLILNNILGLFIGGGLFLIIAVVTRGAMGGGDIKLMGALGFCFGWTYILLISFVSFIIGAIISIFLLAFKIKGRKDYIPFGPFISISALLAMLYGEELIQIYLRL